MLKELICRSHSHHSQFPGRCVTEGFRGQMLTRDATKYFEASRADEIKPQVRSFSGLTSGMDAYSGCVLTQVTKTPIRSIL